jgi:hypothetical protein
MKLSNKSLKFIIQGISLALLIYVTASTAIPVLFTNVYAQTPSLFSVTLIAPTGGNTVRRQYASIITSNMIALGIDAKLFYVTFDQLSNRLFAATAPPGSSFSQGGVIRATYPIFAETLTGDPHMFHLLETITHTTTVPR